MPSPTTSPWEPTGDAADRAAELVRRALHHFALATAVGSGAELVVLPEGANLVRTRAGSAHDTLEFTRLALDAAADPLLQAPPGLELRLRLSWYFEREPSCRLRLTDVRIERDSRTLDLGDFGMAPEDAAQVLARYLALRAQGSVWPDGFASDPQGDWEAVVEAVGESVVFAAADPDDALRGALWHGAIHGRVFSPGGPIRVDGVRLAAAARLPTADRVLQDDPRLTALLAGSLAVTQP